MTPTQQDVDAQWLRASKALRYANHRERQLGYTVFMACFCGWAVGLAMGAVLGGV